MKLVIRGLDKLRQAADPKAFRRAVPLALNRAAASGKTAASGAIRDIYNIKKKELDSYMKFTTKATVARPYVVFRIRSRPLGIIHFGATRVKTKVMRKYGRSRKKWTYYTVSAKILRNERKHAYPGMFIGTAQTSHSQQVFRRVGDRRLPVMNPAVISPTSMFDKYGRGPMEKTFDDVFFKEFERVYDLKRGV